MRKSMLAMVCLLPLGVGCAHVGGICDCAPIPGDSTGYNPHITYHALCPCTTKVPNPGATVTEGSPISEPTTGKDAMDMKGAKETKALEPVPAPKAAPKKTSKTSSKPGSKSKI